MAVFAYKGFDKGGKAIKGMREAVSESILRGSLRKEGLMITDLSETDAKGKKKKKEDGGFLSAEVSFKSTSVSDDEMALLTRQLATLLTAGIPMVEAIAALIDQMEGDYLKGMLSNIKADVNEGTSLYLAFKKHPKVFDKIYVSMVQAGEASGSLDKVLTRLADLKEAQNKLKNEIISAMIYPIMMLFFGTVVGAILFAVVIPKITKIFSQSNAQLPVTTRLLIFISESLRDYWYIALIVAIVSSIAFKRWKATEKGQGTLDYLTISVPIFGPVFRMVAVARFARTLGTLMQAGVELLQALEITKNVVNNKVLGDEIERVRKAVREGAGIAKTLKTGKEFPPMVVHMIGIGEKSGQLEDMLNRVANSYEEGVERGLKRMTQALMPVMTIVMAVGVGFVVFSIMMPILQMSTLVK